MYRKNRQSLAALSVCAGLAAFSPFAQGQTYQRAVDTRAREFDHDIWRTRDGGFVTTGQRVAEDTGFLEDVLVTRYDPAGNVVWQRAWGGQGRDIGYSVQETADGGFVVAAETDTFGEDLGILVFKLDGGGSFVWATLVPGTIDADPLHDPFPGVALDQAENGDIIIVGSIIPRAVAPLLPSASTGVTPFTVGGLPLVNRVRRDGVYLDTAVFTDFGLFEQGFERFHYNFTDVRVTRGDGVEGQFGEDYDIVITGTRAEVLDVIGNPTNPDVPAGATAPSFAGRYDAILFRTSESVMPFYTFAYDFTTDRNNPNFPNSGDWGHGVSISEDGIIAVGGKTDWGSTFGMGTVGGTAPELGSHFFVTDPSGTLLDSRRYDMFDISGEVVRHAPAYAATEIDELVSDNRPVGLIQTGRFDSSIRSNAYLHKVNTGLATIFDFAYGERNTTRGESLTINPRGFNVAGAFTGVGPFALGTGRDQYLFRTDNDGKTPCLIEPLDPVGQDRMRQEETPVICVYPSLYEPLGDQLYVPPTREIVLCIDQPCNNCDDWNGDGVKNVSDLFSFIADFTAGTSPCLDINGDGVVNISDLFDFIRCFNSTP